jgi:hypothetical protein
MAQLPWSDGAASTSGAKNGRLLTASAGFAEEKYSVSTTYLGASRANEWFFPRETQIFSRPAGGFVDKS